MERTSDLFHGPLDEHDHRISAISRDRQVDTRRYSTGLQNVDECAKPWRPGGFVVLGAREGQGKTSLALRAAIANAREHRIVFFSLDMPKEEIQDKVLSQSMQVEAERVVFLEQQDDPHFKRALRGLSEFDLMVLSPPKGERSIGHITRFAEAVTAAMVIIDYTRMIDGWDYGRRAADIVDTAKDWAAKSMITTVMLSQLHNDAVNRRPHNGHLQDTANLGQRADRVGLIYRPYKGKPWKDDIAEIITTKNRWGPELTNHAGWIGETTDFFPLTAEEEDNARCCRSSK